uniref:Uncharacterized protein n=1 Tax=Helianthus annuus TaxID=4232 RepID=A0A251S2B8_HELAN
MDAGWCRNWSWSSCSYISIYHQKFSKTAFVSFFYTCLQFDMLNSNRCGARIIPKI